MSDPTTTDPVRRLTARSAEDLLALAPVVLGFWPHEDAVMLTFAAPRPFHARFGLPGRASPQALIEVERALLGPAVLHSVGAVVFLVFGSSERVARAVSRTLHRGAARRGIDVVACIWADGSRYRVLGGMMAPDAEPVAYDLTAHPFVLEAMVEGRLRYASRDEMVAALEPDAAACAEVAAALGALGLDEGGPGAGEVGRAVAAVRRMLATHVAPDDGGAPPGAADVARLVWSLRAVPARDAAWGLVDRRTAPAHRAFWADLLPRTPEPFVPAVAGLLGFAAWQAGDGAQAWAAVDRARRACPEDRMARLLAGLLDNAVPPDAWSA